MSMAYWISGIVVGVIFGLGLALRLTAYCVMKSNDLYTYFNAPSRAQIYTRIMKLSEGQSWTFDYDTFVKWDKAHPTKTKVATRSMVEIEDEEENVHFPPVAVGKTWKEVIGY